MAPINGDMTLQSKIIKCHSLSHSIRLDKLLTDSEEIVFLVSSLLNDVKERIFHDDLSHFKELIIEEQPFMVRIVPLLLILRRLRSLR